MRRAGKDRAARRASTGGIAAEKAHAIPRPSFDAQIFPSRRETEMQNGAGLERFVEILEFLLGPGIGDRQYGKFEFDAKARQSRPVFFESRNKPCCWVLTDARKAAEASDENAQGVFHVFAEGC